MLNQNEIKKCTVNNEELYLAERNGDYKLYTPLLNGYLSTTIQPNTLQRVLDLADTTKTVTIDQM